MHPIAPVLTRVLAPLALSSLLVAQTAVTISTAVPGGRTRGMESSARTLAMTADGSLWALLWSDDPANPAAARELRLNRSLDGGLTWAVAAGVSTVGNSIGSVTGGTSCDRLHVCWSATDGAAFYSAYYQEFDPSTMQWVGAPQRLIQGQGSNDQYYGRDVTVTPRGAVAVSIQSHRTPTTVPVGGWAGLLMVRPAGAAAFQGPFQINTDSTGMHADLQAVGEVVHSAFRTSNGSYGIRYRAFDIDAMAFVQSSDVPLEGTAQSQMNANNANSIAADRDGNLYVLHAKGASATGSGEIRMAYAPGGNTANWTTQLVAADPDMIRGNVNYPSFSLAVIGPDSVMAIYSKLTGEQHQNLYARIYGGGVALTPEILLIGGARVDRFRFVSAMRSGNGLSGALVACGDGNTSVEFVSVSGDGRAVRLGTGCATGQGAVPALSSRSVPTAGMNLDLRVDGGAPAGVGILFVGNVCNATPQALSPFGLTGCELFHDITGSVLFTNDAAGRGTISIPIPSSANYTGVPIYVGALALVPGANPASAVTANSLMVWVQ